MIIVLNNSSRLKTTSLHTREIKIICKLTPIQQTGQRKPPVKAPTINPLWMVISGIGE